MAEILAVESFESFYNKNLGFDNSGNHLLGLESQGFAAQCLYFLCVKIVDKTIYSKIKIPVQFNPSPV